MREQAHNVLGLADDAVSDNYSITIEDAFGTERLSSVMDLPSSRFSDTTSAITLGVQKWRPHAALELNFTGDIVLISRIRIVTIGAQARETALGCYHGILRLLEPQRTWAGIFHPPIMLKTLMWALTPVCLAALPVAFLAKKPSLLTAAVVGGSLAIIAYVVGGVLNPYTAFASRRTDMMAKTWSWLGTGLAAFIMFGTLMTLLRKKLLGF